MRAALLATTLLALMLAAPAAGGRYAIGLHRGASPDAVAKRVEAATGGSVSRLTPFALVLQGRTATGVAGLAGVSYVERLERSRRVAFTPNDPLARKQWNHSAIHAFDTWPSWPLRPALPGVKVAVIDSGIDGSHPEFEHRIEEAVTFVDSSPRKDAVGHGTFVAGLIAAELNNATGIAGVGFPAQLLVAKVVRADGTISPEDEARAIRWAVDRGARVINLSLAAFRDPDNPAGDQYSPLEAAAIEYAVRNGVLVVAAVGNADGAPRVPWRYASYPAALPHVIGVGALARDGSIPDFSNRDELYNDLVAPGTEILSTIPRTLAGERPACSGYSGCGPDDFRRGEGTSFASAQVSAAAAVVIAQRPELRPEQVSALLERSATDVGSDTGCKRCAVGRDDTSGWGLLNVAAAVGRIGSDFAEDAFEPNDEAGTRAWRIKGSYRELRATLDAWDDPSDVYRVFMKREQTLALELDSRTIATTLTLWRPGARSVGSPLAGLPAAKPLVQRSTFPGVMKLVRHEAQTRGWYFVQVEAAAGETGGYRLTLSKR